jgi:hypothetical protein
MDRYYTCECYDGTIKRRELRKTNSSCALVPDGGSYTMNKPLRSSLPPDDGSGGRTRGP